jgi:selenocysteine-specific elongation factor
VDEPTTIADLTRRALLDEQELEAGLAGVERAGDWVFSAGWLEETGARIRERLAAAPELDPGVHVGELLPTALAPHVLPRIGVEQRAGKAYLPGASPTLGGREATANMLVAEVADAGAHGAKVEDDELARYLEREGRLVRLRDGYAVSPEIYATARDTLVAECETAGRITLARFRDLLGISRRPAQMLLERFDADGLTRRVGDERVLRRSALRG